MYMVEPEPKPKWQPLIVRIKGDIWTTRYRKYKFTGSWDECWLWLTFQLQACMEDLDRRRKEADDAIRKARNTSW
jgi:hypothetical protein